MRYFPTNRSPWQYPCQSLKLEFKEGRNLPPKSQKSILFITFFGITFSTPLPDAPSFGWTSYQGLDSEQTSSILEKREWHPSSHCILCERISLRTVIMMKFIKKKGYGVGTSGAKSIRKTCYNCVCVCEMRKGMF